MSKHTFYSRRSYRLQNWNYVRAGSYFVTINTRFRINYFGEIINGRMALSDIGEEVAKQWLITPIIRPDMNLTLDAFVVMPNHFHGLLRIGKNDYNRFLNSYSLNDIHLSENNPGFPQIIGLIKQPQNSFGPQRKNLGSVIRGFKSSVTTWCRINHKQFDWQPRYHENFIRNNKHLMNVRNYLKTNPSNWHRDRFNGANR